MVRCPFDAAAFCNGLAFAFFDPGTGLLSPVDTRFPDKLGSDDPLEVSADFLSVSSSSSRCDVSAASIPTEFPAAPDSSTAFTSGFTSTALSSVFNANPALTTCTLISQPLHHTRGQGNVGKIQGKDLVTGQVAGALIFRVLSLGMWL